MMYKVAVIGDANSVSGFRVIGADVFSPANADGCRRLVDKLAKEQYGVIFITEQFAMQVEETIARYKTEAIPALILIPNSEGSLGIGLKEISENVEKAVGRSLF